MATICEFGMAPEQAKKGYVGIGTAYGTDEEVLKQFWSDLVRLVRGVPDDNGIYEYFVMVKVSAKGKKS